ncbi:MAG: anion transporter [Holophaga sp.]|nr:anion transporter [Holophaga sp.]
MHLWLTLVIVTLTFVGIALGKFPFIRSNRTTITLMGAGLLLASRQITFQQAGSFLSLDTLVLLFGMMIINANLQMAGFFRLAGAGILHYTRSPRSLLALEIIVAGILSALFLNDTVCLMLTPLVLDITLGARRNPVPYLIALATASNIGSVATLTGNPQNMIIGTASRIPYLQFTTALAPIALLGLGGIWLILVLFYRDEFRPGVLEPDLGRPYFDRRLLTKSLVVTAGLLAAFLAGAPTAEAAFIAGCALLFTRRVRPTKMLDAIDTELLVFFAALFVVSGTIESSGLSARMFQYARPWLNGGAVVFSAIAVLLSNLVSNVPAVLLLKPLMGRLAHPQAAWLTLAATSTLAGNLTLLGSVANLIVAEGAARRGVRLTFREFTRSASVITLISLVLGVGWIQLFIWR